MGTRLSDAHPPLWQRLAWYACGALVLLLLPVLKYAGLVGIAATTAACAAGGAGRVRRACLLSLFLDRVASWPAAGKALIRSFVVLSLFLIAAVALSIVLPRFLLIPSVLVMAVAVPLAISHDEDRRNQQKAGLGQSPAMVGQPQTDRAPAAPPAGDPGRRQAPARPAPPAACGRGAITAVRFEHRQRTRARRRLPHRPPGADAHRLNQSPSLAVYRKQLRAQ